MVAQLGPHRPREGQRREERALVGRGTPRPLVGRRVGRRGDEPVGVEGLELHRVGAGVGRDVDEPVGEVGVAVVVDARLGDDDDLSRAGQLEGADAHRAGAHRAAPVARAGTPATTAPSATSATTTAPAPTTTPDPTRTPGSTLAPGPDERSRADLGRPEEHRPGRDVAAVPDDGVVLDHRSGVDDDRATEPGARPDVRVLEDDRAVPDGRRRGDGRGRRDDGWQGDAGCRGPVEQQPATGVVADPEGDGAAAARDEVGEVGVAGQDRDVPGRAPRLPAHGDDLRPAADEDVVDDAGVPTGTDEAPRRDVRPEPL